MISIPLSLLIGVTLLHYLGFNLNQLSIVGFVVALGLLVDDSIVVVENIERWMRDGYTRLETTIQGTKQIGVAVIGCTATLMIAFFPLILMPEASGDFIRSLPMAVVTTVFASLIVAFTVIPFFCNILLHKKYAKDNEGKLLFRFLKNSINKVYAPVLDKSLRKPIISIGIAVLLFIGSLMLIPIVGFSLFPPSEKPQFLINVVTPLQSNLTHTNKIALDIENVLHEMPDIKYFSTNVGKGNPMIYYNQMQENERTDYAQIFVQLDENTSSTRKMEVIDALRIKFKKFDGVKIEVKNFEQGPSILAPVEVKLYGENLDTLSVLADRVQTMLKNTEGTMYIDNPLSNKKTDLRVKINKEKAQMYGIMSSDIYRNIRMVVAGLNMGNISTDNDDDFELIITAPKGEQATLDIFDNLHINNYQGKSIPIKQIATLELESSPVSIRHQNKTRMTSVSAFVQKGFLNVQVNNVVVKKMEQLKLPQGYNYKMGGELESREESFGGFGTVIIITIFLFLAILILEFKTFKSTLIVLSVIPLGIIGALVALALTNNSMSFVANIGLIALAGIEVKNSILLVDFTNQLRAEGKSLEFAIREAGEIRFLPIVLTTLTAIFGLLPIAISSNPLISPLAIVIIGGLISSTILSRIVTPVLYKLLPPQVQVLNIETDQAKKIEG